MSKILIADDELDSISVFINLLNAKGHDVTTVDNIAAAKEVIFRETIDLVVTDVNFLPAGQILHQKALLTGAGERPDVEEEDAGYGLVSWIREHSPILWVVVMSSQRVSPEDQVEGLSRGADAFFEKSLSDHSDRSQHSRLGVAVIEAVLGRRRPLDGTLLFSRMSFDRISRALQTSNGTIIDLTDSEFALLDILSSHPREIMTREHLHWCIFGKEMGSSSRAIDTLVSKLREKMPPTEGPEVGSTVYGRGYRFDPDVTFVSRRQGHT